MHKSVDLSEFLCSDRGEQWVRFPPRNWIRASLHSAVVYREERVKFKEQRGTCDDCHALRSSLIPSPTLICTTYLLPQNLVTSSLLVSLISPLVDVCGEHVDLSLLALCGCVTGCILCTQLVLWFSWWSWCPHRCGGWTRPAQHQPPQRPPREEGSGTRIERLKKTSSQTPPNQQLINMDRCGRKSHSHSSSQHSYIEEDEDQADICVGRAWIGLRKVGRRESEGMKE